MYPEKISFDKKDDHEAKNLALGQRLNKIYSKNRLAVYDKIYNFSMNLQNSYPDFIQSELYHVLISSTSPVKFVKFDFPGDDSVEKFIGSLEKEYLKPAIKAA